MTALRVAISSLNAVPFMSFRLKYILLVVGTKYLFQKIIFYYVVLTENVYSRYLVLCSG